MEPRVKTSTRKRYETILRLLLRGKEPKEIAHELTISVHVVYEVLRWQKIVLNLPKIAQNQKLDNQDTLS